MQEWMAYCEPRKPLAKKYTGCCMPCLGLANSRPTDQSRSMYKFKDLRRHTENVQNLYNHIKDDVH